MPKQPRRSSARTAQTKNFGQNKPCLLWEVDYQYSSIKPVNIHAPPPLTSIHNTQIYISEGDAKGKPLFVKTVIAEIFFFQIDIYKKLQL